MLLLICLPPVMGSTQNVGNKMYQGEGLGTEVWNAMHEMHILTENGRLKMHEFI